MRRGKTLPAPRIFFAEFLVGAEERNGGSIAKGPKIVETARRS
jgi:hypothetical protein